MIRPRKAIERLKKYRPPQEGRSGKMRLDFNENTVGCPPQVIRALRRALNPEMMTRYPEYDEGRRMLATYFKVAPEQLLLANGTDDAIKSVCDAFVDPDDILLVPAPTFPVYEFFNNVAGGKTLRIRYDENFRLPTGEFVATLRKGKVRWVALANPNNPTGTQIPKTDLKAILLAAPDTLVLVDEAYQDFSGETILPWIRKYPNLIVSRTFSKAFGLAALRLGCMFADAGLIESLQRGQNPFAVNSLAMICAGIAIQYDAQVREYAEEIRANRAAFLCWLDRQGIPYVPSSANFVLTRVGAKAPEIAGLLRAKGILVRDWSYDPHLKGYLRFTVGSAPQMRRLTRELERTGHLIETRNGARTGKNLASYSTAGWFT
jgi:histidinol-phosphate aminotransferase